jgi:hypothetical protein
MCQSNAELDQKEDTRLMANDLTTAEGKEFSTDTVTLQGLQTTVQRLYGALGKDGTRDTLPALPPPQLRGRMRARQLDLNTQLRPISMASAERDRAFKAISALLGGYLNIKSDNPQAVAAGYTAHLIEQPLFAILQACDDFKNRRVYDLNADGERVPFTIDHAPSAFRLLDQVKKCAADMREEHYQIGRVLAVKQIATTPMISPDEQARVAAAMRLRSMELGSVADAGHQADMTKTQREAQEARDRAAKITEDGIRRRAAFSAEQEAQSYEDLVR